MPDVIIKGMEMPNCCRACKLNNDTICALINGCVYDETDGSTRRPDCHLRPAPEWISVEERLPEQNIQCLIWTDKGWCGFGSCGIYDGEAEWDTESYWVEEDGLVTHWMPLPEPPDGGDGDG